MFVGVLFHRFVDASLEILDGVSVEFQDVVVGGGHGVRGRALFHFGESGQRRPFYSVRCVTMPSLCL